MSTLYLTSDVPHHVYRHFCLYAHAFFYCCLFGLRYFNMLVCKAVSLNVSMNIIISTPCLIQCAFFSWHVVKRKHMAKNKNVANVLHWVLVLINALPIPSRFLYSWFFPPFIPPWLSLFVHSLIHRLTPSILFCCWSTI